MVSWSLGAWDLHMGFSSILCYLKKKIKKNEKTFSVWVEVAKALGCHSKGRATGFAASLELFD